MEMYEIIPSILQRLIWIPIRLLLAIFCSLAIKGIENIKDIKSNVIIASNHSSELDPVIIAASLPFFSRHLPLFFTSREKEFYKDMGWKKIIYGGTFFNSTTTHLISSFVRSTVRCRGSQPIVAHLSALLVARGPCPAVCSSGMITPSADEQLCVERLLASRRPPRAYIRLEKVRLAA